MTKGCLVVFGILVVIVGGFLAYSSWYVPWRYLAPYRALVGKHATEEEVIRTPVAGKPNYLLGGSEELRKFTKYQRLMNTESKVFVYRADPWHNAEGLCVYLFFDRSGRAARVELGPM